MKAVAVFPNEKTVDLVDHPEPPITSATQAKIRILDIGVCGTDKEICAFEYGVAPEESDYLIIGHESLGEVVEVGPDVKNLKPGDLVVPMVRRPCHHDDCVACTAGRQDFCFTGDFRERGIHRAHGFMTEFVVEESRYLNPVPRELRNVAALVEPLTIAEKALEQVWNIQSRLPWGCPIIPGKKNGNCHRAVVLGAGPVGLLGAMALANADFDTYIYSRSPDIEAKTKLAESFGAHYIPAEKYTPKDFMEMAGPVDVVFEAVGASQLAFEVLALLGTNGVFVFSGVPGRRGPITVDTDALMRNLVLKNQVIFGTVNAGQASFQAAIRDIGTFAHKWPKVLPSLVTGRFPIEQHKDLLLGRVGGIKNMLTFEAA